MAEKQHYDASSIRILEGLEAVRTRPGMYIGSTSTRGLNHLIYEIVDNSVDEHLAGYCDAIRVTLEADGSCTVVDDGRGIPIDMHAKGISAELLPYICLNFIMATFDCQYFLLNFYIVAGLFSTVRFLRTCSSSKALFPAEL